MESHGVAPTDGSPTPRRSVVVPYPASNSTVRTRAIAWIERLVEAGIGSRESMTIHGPGFSGGAVRPGSDVLLVRNARRLTRGRTEQRILERASFGVYDLDDGLPWDSGSLSGLGHWWKRPWPRSLVAQRAASAADRVIAGNATLAEWADQHCRDVVLIPTCIEPDDYVRRTDWARSDRPLIGWIGSPATTGYLSDISVALRTACDRTGAQIEVIGADVGQLEAIADIATFVAWDEHDAQQRIATWDVGMMPLRDGVYERAKCGYKLLQYAAAGVPAVGSPVGVNREILTAMDGLAPTTIDQWTEALIAVVDESDERRRVRAVAGSTVAAAYSYAAWQDRWMAAVGWFR